MPGFNIGSTSGVGNKIEPRRKHRFEFETPEIVFPDSKAALLLKSATRPKISIDEIPVKWNQETAYWDGQHEWDPMTLTWYDVHQDNDTSLAIWKWLNSVIDLPGASGQPTAQVAPFYKRNSKLIMTDNTGNVNQFWELSRCWPRDVDWGDLDYADSEIALITCTMRFDRAVHKESIQAAGSVSQF